MSVSDTFSIHDFIKIWKFSVVTQPSPDLEVLWVSVWDTFSVDESIRIGRFWAVTWPSPVLEILWVSASSPEEASVHDRRQVARLKPGIRGMSCWLAHPLLTTTKQDFEAASQPASKPQRANLNFEF